MSRLTAVVLTKNEQVHLPDCLASLHWCDEVLVLDSCSTDRTVEIAREFGATVVQRPFINFADQHNAAIDWVTSEWVFFVDADERISPELAAEISTVRNDPQYNGYWLPRYNYQLGKLILNAGLYPDYHLRLFRARKGRYDVTQIVHERVILEGESGRLENPIIHISCEHWDEFIDHQKRYAPMKAQIHYERGVRSTYHFVAGPILEFIRRYLVLKGYRDGRHGLYLSWLFAYYYFVMFVHLRRLWKTGGHEGPPVPDVFDLPS